MTDNKCEHCGTEIIDQCLRCGAPQCCPKCCQEANHDPNITRAGPDHAYKPDDGKVGNKLPWD